MPSRLRRSRRASAVLVAVVATLATAGSLLSVTPSASATRVPPPPDKTRPSFTEAQAETVLKKAQRQLRVDRARLRAKKPVPATDPSTDITMTLRDLAFARASLTGADRAKADAILARPTDAGGDVLGDDISAVSYDGVASQNRRSYCGSVACVQWVTTGSERLSDSQQRADVNRNGVPDYVDTVYSTIQSVWNSEVGTMGYRPPLPDGGGTAGNPNGKIDIYLANLGARGLYGYCTTDAEQPPRQSPAYCVLDTDYAGFGTPSLNALRVTAAHEFFHAVQFGYDSGEDVWLMEGTATWIEDEVYDSINDNVQYLKYSQMRSPTVPLDANVPPNWYGSWLFFKYVSERLGRNAVRDIWQRAQGGGSSYSLNAIRAAVSARTPWVPFFATYTAWNTRQPRGYSEAFSSRYPTPVFTGTKVLTKKRKSTKWLAINLRHLSAAPLKVIPGPKLARNKKLRIQVDIPPIARGGTVLLQRRYKNGVVLNRLVPLNSQGNGSIKIGFNRKYLAYVALIPSNTSTAMVACGTNNYFSCGGRGYYDYNQTYAIRATVS